MFKCYRQLEHSDCGLTCIRMVARHFGAKIPIKYLKSIADVNRLGMSIKDIKDCCKKIGLDCAAARFTPEHLRRLPLPAVLYWEQKHFVVLYKIDERRGLFYIADPELGKIHYKIDEFFSYWLVEGSNEGLAIMFEPSDDFYKKNYTNEKILVQFLKYINLYLTNHKHKFSIAAGATILIMAADAAIPLLLKKTIDEGIFLKDLSLVVCLLLCQFAIMIGSLVSSGLLNVFLVKTGLSINLQMVNSFLEKLAKFPLSFFDRKVSSDFVQKINDQSRIKDFLMTFPNTVIIMLLNLAGENGVCWDSIRS